MAKVQQPSLSIKDDCPDDPESQLNLNLLHQQISQLDLDDAVGTFLHFPKKIFKLIDSMTNVVHHTKVPEDRCSLEQMIQRYIRLIRVDCADEKTKRELIVRLCELRIKLNALNEEEDIKYTCGHFFVDSQLTSLSSSASRTCEICMKRSKSLLIAPLLMSTSTSNPILNCSFCCYAVHQQCSSNLVRIG